MEEMLYTDRDPNAYEFFCCKIWISWEMWV